MKRQSEPMRVIAVILRGAAVHGDVLAEDVAIADLERRGSPACDRSCGSAPSTA